MSLINLYSDEVVFRMQRAGGVSTVFAEILSRAAEDPDVELRILSNGTAIDNVPYDEKQLGNVKKLPERFNALLLERITKAALTRDCVDGNAIFNGTYFRTSSTPGVINVLHVHDFTHQLFFPKKQATVNSVLKRKCIRDADAIVCISQNTKNDLIRFYPEAAHKRVEVIYNGISSEFVYNPEVDVPGIVRECGIGDYVLFVGSRAPYKRFGIALELVKRISDLSLVVIGGGELTDDEKAEAGEAVSRVHQFGGVSTEDLNALYTNAVALVYPSQYEGFGIPPLEAMRSGCPAVAFNNSSLPEVMGDAGVLIEEGDFEGLCEAVARLRRDAAWRDSVVKAQLAQGGVFNWDAAYEQLKALYISLIGGEGDFSC